MPPERGHRSPYRARDGRFAVDPSSPRCRPPGDGEIEDVSPAVTHTSRQIRFFGHLITHADPLRGLDAVRLLHRHVDLAEAHVVLRARSAGWSWRDIADALERSPQLVHRRYARFGPRRPRRRRSRST